ncbi:hypothetical protein TWF718_005801 [Orbilia javanica]|uniref:Uncharacterized protein n=1 Tax=Orbilia javanica TaxID=47235 RepID=A0AAN8REG4_9PEZI
MLACDDATSAKPLEHTANVQNPVELLTNFVDINVLKFVMEELPALLANSHAIFNANMPNVPTNAARPATRAPKSAGGSANIRKRSAACLARCLARKPPVTKGAQRNLVASIAAPLFVERCVLQRNIASNALAPIFKP